MQNVEACQQLRQGFAQAAVDALRAQAAARHEQHGLLSVESSQRQPGRTASAEQLRPERGARQHALVSQRAGAFGERRRHFGGEARADAVGQPGGEVALVAYGRHAAQPGAEHHRHAHKAALGKAHVGPEPAHESNALKRAPDDAEGIGEVLQAEIAAQLAAFDGMVGDVGKPGDHLVLNAVFRADVVDVVACLAQMRNQAQVRGHVPGGAAPGQYDAFAHGALLSW